MKNVVGNVWNYYWNLANNNHAKDLQLMDMD